MKYSKFKKLWNDNQNKQRKKNEYHKKSNRINDHNFINIVN